jgi:tetratricopeptide (TPR) repeat protein
LLVCAAIGLASLWRAADAALALTRRERWIALALAAAVVACWAVFELRVPQVGPRFWSALPGLLWALEVPTGFGGHVHFERYGLFLALALLLGMVALGRAGGGVRRVTAIVFAALGLGMQVQRLVRLPSRYAQHVHDIQKVDAGLGRWAAANVAPNTRVAVNDIGAIAYFGQRPIVDAIGLATPELTPYWSQRRLRTLIGMRPMRPQYCIIFPIWFPEWLTLASLLHPVAERHVDKATILGGRQAIVYRLDWDRFGRYYTDAMIERLDPVDVDASFEGHVRRGRRNLTTMTRAQLYASAGDFLRDSKQLAAAEAHYRRAIALDPTETTAWAGLIRLVDQKGDVRATATAAMQMARALPESPVAQEALGQCQETLGLAAEAAAQYRLALEMRPDNVRVLRSMERVLTKLGDTAGVAEIRARRVELEGPAALAAPGGATQP